MREQFSAWKVNGKDQYFNKMSNSTWSEIVDGITVFSFDLVKQNNDTVVIFASDRDFYLTINSNSVRWGPTVDLASQNLIYNGKWLN